MSAWEFEATGGLGEATQGLPACPRHLAGPVSGLSWSRSPFCVLTIGKWMISLPVGLLKGEWGLLSIEDSPAHLAQELSATQWASCLRLPRPSPGPGWLAPQETCFQPDLCSDLHLGVTSPLLPMAPPPWPAPPLCPRLPFLSPPCSLSYLYLLPPTPLQMHHDS